MPSDIQYTTLPTNSPSPLRGAIVVRVAGFPAWAGPGRGSRIPGSTRPCAASTRPWFDWVWSRVARLVEAKTPLDVLSCPRQREYHWHKHDDEDEFFYVVDGELIILMVERAGVQPTGN